MNKSEALDHIDAALRRVHDAAQARERSLLAGWTGSEAQLAEAYLKVRVPISDLDLAEGRPLPTDVEAEVMRLDLAFAGLQGRRRRLWFVTGMATLAALALLAWWLDVDVRSLLGDIPATRAVLYTSLGVFGAFVFFLTQGAFSEPDTNPPLSPEGESNKQPPPGNMPRRIALAFIMPVVFIIVLRPDATTGTPDPDWVALLCFAVGYSTKLAALLLEKIVEKGKVMIDAI